MLIESIERKVKFTLLIALIGLSGGVVIACLGLYQGYMMVQESQRNVYVISNDVPLLARRVGDNQASIATEGKALIKSFHRLFFTLPPDDEYMNRTLKEALYLIDESGVRQRNALNEKGFYSHILSQSANFSIVCDSIILDGEAFTYYGTQRIEGKTSVTRRSLVTTGKLAEIPRTENNPFGYMITDYKTISNKDISTSNIR